VQVFGQHQVAGQSLVERNKQHDIVRESHGPEEDGGFSPSDFGTKQRAHEVPHHRQMCGGVGHLGKTAIASREPLPIDFELQYKKGSHEDAPSCGVDGASDCRRKSNHEEHASDPWGKEEVDAHGVMELPSHCLEEVDDLQAISCEDEDEGQESQAPERDVDLQRDVQEVQLGGGCQVLP